MTLLCLLKFLDSEKKYPYAPPPPHLLEKKGLAENGAGAGGPSPKPGGKEGLAVVAGAPDEKPGGGPLAVEAGAVVNESRGSKRPSDEFHVPSAKLRLPKTELVDGGATGPLSLAGSRAPRAVIPSQSPKLAEARRSVASSSSHSSISAQALPVELLDIMEAMESVG